MDMTPDVDEGGYRVGSSPHGLNHEMPCLHTGGSRKASEREADHDSSIDPAEETSACALHKAHSDSLLGRRPAGGRCPVVRGTFFFFPRLRSEDALGARYPLFWVGIVIRPCWNGNITGTAAVNHQECVRVQRHVEFKFVKIIAGVFPVPCRNAKRNIRGVLALGLREADKRPLRIRV